ncbi:hypothetical protein OG282_00260 [Streptomyces sp. NBC_01014]|nr:hypothetical protein [Streptomyces sp. NBC_01500]MCX4553220.1 hypothetical protein [Streptomyces sp. NBC_01500]WSV52238.1 hypothetical protein OG282_00260 [Streptomyces sp. NBC_01014]
MADQHVHAGPIEEVGAVCEHAPHVLATRHDVEGQVEPAGHAAEAKRGAVRTVQGELFVGSVKELEGDLHERVVAEVPFRCERLDQRLEGQVLMGEGAERGLAHPVEQLAERQLRPATDSYREGVDEEADQGLGLGAGTVRGRHAHHHVVLAAVPRQQHLEGTEQRHEQGDALLPAERFQPCDQRCGQRELYGFAPMGLDGGTRIVCRQAQHQGRAIQCPLPKGDLLLLHRAGHPGPLPDGEVGVLDIQPWQCGGGAGDAFPIEAPEFVHQDVNRPAVGDDVVHGDHQCVILVRQSGCHHTHQRAVRQPERGARLCRHQVPHTPLGSLGQIDPHDLRHAPRAGRVRGRDDLVGHTISLDEGRPQRLVPRDQHPQRPLQRIQVEWAADPVGVAHIVEDAAGHQLVKEPQALLRERQRQRPAPVHRLKGRSPVADALGLFGADADGQLLDRRGVEQCPQRYLDTEELADPGNHLDRQQRVPAQLEEVVVHTDPVDAEHGAPDLCHDLFHHVTRRHEADVQSRPAHLGQRQAPAVQLSVRRQWQRVQDHHRRRHHVRGQSPLREAANAGGVGPAPDRGRDIGDQPRVLVVDDGGFLDGGVVGEGGFDLAGFDAEAAEFDLVVGAAEVFEGAVGAPAGTVAGAVEAAAGGAAVGVSDEALGGETGSVDVAAGESQAAEVDLPGDTDGHRLKVCVENTDPHMRQGSADDGDVNGRGEVVTGRVDGRFGRAVEVEAADTPLAAQRLPQRRRDRLTAHHDHGRRPLLLQQTCGNEEFELRRSRVDDVDPVLLDEPDQGRGVAAHILGRDEQLVTRQHPAQLLHGRVERERRGERRSQLPVAGRHTVGPGEIRVVAEEGGLQGACEVVQGAVLDDDALRRARRAGRVNDVRGLVGADVRGGRRAVGRGLPRIEVDAAGACGQVPGNDDGGCDVVQDIGGAVGGPLHR